MNTITYTLIFLSIVAFIYLITNDSSKEYYHRIHPCEVVCKPNATEFCSKAKDENTKHGCIGVCQDNEKRCIEQKNIDDRTEAEEELKKQS